ncbi:MAG: DUF2191 domain-containing protein [Gemmatimonadetes bacterium]|nr:DUF2191 domain-containing protein [Gemmatimonadota bacterium]
MATTRTTLRLSPALMKRAKAYARERDTTLTMVMEHALAEYLAKPVAAGRKPVKLPSYGRGGLLPGVNLDSNSELMDLMDGIE